MNIDKFKEKYMDYFYRDAEEEMKDNMEIEADIDALIKNEVKKKLPSVIELSTTLHKIFGKNFHGLRVADILLGEIEEALGLKEEGK